MVEDVIRLPWPNSILSSNSSAAWYKKAPVTKKARFDAFVLAKHNGVQKDPNAILEFTYHPPDRRKRDCQNVATMLKAYIDGIADAMGVDDNGFRVKYPDQFAEVIKGGCVLVSIRKDTECSNSL